MTDDETPTSVTDESGEDWVVATNYSMRRAPGILDAPETTYVVGAPNRIPRRTLIVGTAIALGSIAIGTALVLAAGGNEDPGLGEAEVSAAATLTSTTTLPEPTTTTAPPAPPSTTPNPTTATTRAPSFAAPARPAPAAPAAPAPTPPATANPALGPYQPVPVPVGVSATLSACTWNGGTLQAAGSITSHSANGRTWTITMHWLQGGRSLAQQTATVDLAPSESKPWALVLPFNRPADLACSLEIS